MKLYKQAKKGDKLQVWWLEIQGSKFRSHEGFDGGTITVGSWVDCFGKNIGKANETSPEEQAKLELEARYQKKKDKGYTENPNDCSRPFEPTLAHTLEDYKDKVVFPGLQSAKLDGVRCLYRGGKIYSRNNKEIISCPHIVRKINDLGLQDLELDGELYNHSLKDDFNQVISLVRQTKPTQEDLDKSAATIQFHVFDYVDYTKTYFERYNDLVAAIDLKIDIVTVVPHEVVNSWEEVDKDNFENVNLGFEGSMLRWSNEVGYHNGRTKYLLKIKSFDNAEFEVIDIESGRGKRSDTVGRWIVKLSDGTTNEVGPTGTDEFNKNIWINKDTYIGKFITVKYQGFTPDSKLRFPTFVSVRDYE